MAEPALAEAMDGLDMESDDEYDLPQAGEPATSKSDIKREQLAIVDSWFTTAAAQEVLRPKSKSLRHTDAGDEHLSLQDLIAKRGTEIIKNPRDYQLELFERAKTQNTIAVLDTGSGKTLIAVLLHRWIIDNELERRAGESPKISFFLVQSVTLVHQQFEVVKTNLDHKVSFRRRQAIPCR